MKNLKSLLLSSTLLAFPASLFAAAASGGEYALTKALLSASGAARVTSADYSAVYAMGEGVAGTRATNGDYELLTGYLSGYFGNADFKLLTVTIGDSPIRQDGIQIGVPLNAPVTLNFSSPIDQESFSSGIQVLSLLNHLGQAENSIILSTSSYDVQGTTVIVHAQTAWPGNSILDVIINSNLRSIDGFSFSPDAHNYFLSVFNPQEENVVLHPLPLPTAVANALPAIATSLSLDLTPGSFTDYGYVRFSEDPEHTPLQVDPQLLNTATQKAQALGGAYETPLAVEEVVSYSQQGQPMTLSKPASISIAYRGTSPASSSSLLRSDTLSLWILDSAHTLWAKIADSRTQGVNVTSSVSRLSAFALMPGGGGTSEGSSVYVYPMPWRPHGSNSGPGERQTGTDNDGITFNNLPAECKIQIYTVSGKLVREMHHSDLLGSIALEKWDGNTADGEHAASGVYLWHVESSADTKNGKLMVIR